MRRADRMLAEVYEKAGAADRYRGTFYPGPHKFDRDDAGRSVRLVRPLAEGVMAAVVPFHSEAIRKAGLTLQFPQ